ncbi:MAG: class I SAM-dependent methyltransferase [Dehalococcoidales bacterium]|nr:class I SAM-dependent methyltransferase [Dehalococcoidales bacterium]
MRERLKRALIVLLQRLSLYGIATRLSSNLRSYSLRTKIMGTRAQEQEWASRHLRHGNDWGDLQHSGEKSEWVLGYWESRAHKHRPLLVEKIARFAPLDSALEIGCNCGPNLYLLARRFPRVRFTGIDINAASVAEGGRLLAAEGITNVTLAVARADELARFPDRSFDIVFSDAVLIYVGPDKIRQVIGDMLRIARKGVVLLERYVSAKDDKDERAVLGKMRKGLWHRDYAALVRRFVPGAQIQVTGITGETWPDAGWREAGALVEIRFPVDTR